MKKIISLVLCVCLLCNVAFAVSNISLAQNLAEDLKALNLFFGVSGDNNFDLERSPTRVEALVMLIRVLGAEKEATGAAWPHPFTDVPAWADRYVGYAYKHGLANGVGITTFGTGRANAAMYLTFVLRALGYTEEKDGFTWDQPFDIARQVGILSSRVDTANFLRADVVIVSYAALSREVKGTGKTLAEKLISDGVFSKTQFDTYYDAKALTDGGGELNAEGVYQKCAKSVFYVEVSDARGEPFASGSGFFITSDGIAVTNYHVIEGASSAKIVLSDSQKEYTVAGVLNYSEKEDWAVIKVNGSGFTPLEIGEKSSVVGGANVYAIGSPLGLQNTISQGIISNVEREIGGTTYIQCTVAISNGSSGGALINKYGQVIGITTASVESGQSVNLAVPIWKATYNKGASVTSLASISNSKPSVSGGIGSGSSGGTANEDDALSAIYEIATRHNNFDYGDYIGWTGESEEGDEVIDIVYSREYDTLFIDYDVYMDSGSRYNFFMVFDDTGAQVDAYTLSCYENEYTDTPYFEGTGELSRGRLNQDSSLRFDDYDSSQHLSASSIESMERVAGIVAWLAVFMLDETMLDFTNGQIGATDLGYTSLYN